MNKVKKVVKKTKKKTVVTKQQPEVVVEINEGNNNPSMLSRAKSIFDKSVTFVLAPTVIVALISIAPQLIDKVYAYRSNMTYEDYIVAKKHLSYWEEYADCLSKDPIVITNGKDEIKLRMCDKTIIMTEFQSVARNKIVHSWLDLDVKEPKRTTTTMLLDLYAQQIKARNVNDGINARVERQQKKVICKTITEDRIVYYIKTKSGCIEKTIMKMTGETNIIQTNCEKICKN